MKHRRRAQDFRTLPTLDGLARRSPFAGFEFAFDDMRFLFRRTLDEEEPCIEAARAEGRRHPTPDECEIVGVEMKPVMSEQLGKRHAP